MDFLSRHEKTLKPGNLAFTLILIVATLGMNAYLYTRLGGRSNGDNNIVQPADDQPPNSYYFTGKSYDLVASTVASIVATGTVVGAILAKINNDHLGGARVFETTGLFLMILVLIICLSLMLVPREDNTSSGTSDEEDSSYEAVILCLASILLGMICVMTGSAKEYTVLGTSFWFMMTIIALALTVHSYRVATNEDNIGAQNEEHNLARVYSDNEKSLAVASISFLSIVAALGFIHMFLDGKSFSKLTGVDYRIVSSPYRTASPKRRTSPRRKLTSLKPKRK